MIHIQQPPQYSKPNYFKTFLGNYLAKYKNILASPNVEVDLKNLSRDIKFCIDKFWRENGLVITHEGRNVSEVNFTYVNGNLGISIS